MLRHPKNRGNILAIALALMCVLVTVVIAMHTSQVRAVRSVTQAEAELQFRQGAEFATAELFSTAQPLPSDLRVTAKDELLGDLQMADKYGTSLWSGLPNWNPKGQEYAPGHKTYRLKPTTSDDALKVFAGRDLWLAGHSDGGYAVYAPNGGVTLESGLGWANPAFGNTDASGSAPSGVPFTVAAKGKIEMEKLPYGNVYSLDGPIELNNGASNLGIAFRGPFPLRNYEDALKSSLSSAKGALDQASLSGDKTKDINGNIGIDTVLSMFTSGGAPSLTLEQATSFPFPLIPSFSATIPGVFFEFWFHVPYAPDFSVSSNQAQALEQQAAADAQKLETLNTQIASLEKQLHGLQTYLNSLQNANPKTPETLAQIAAIQSQIANGDPNSVEVAGIIATIKKLEQKGSSRTAAEDQQLIELQLKRANLESKLDDLTDELKDLNDSKVEQGEEWTDKLKNGVGGENVPVTRAEDANIPNKGQKGWNYSRLVGKAWDLLGLLVRTAFTMDFDGLAKEFSEEVRVVHFGGKDYIPEFTFGSGSFSTKSSWTVPPGRSFRYSGDMQIKGDLWLQKGSVMAVTGNLTMVDPGTGSTALEPSGKIVLEQGATLLVGGTLQAAGRPEHGSLWSCSPLGSISPVSSAIFVGQNVNIPYGSFSAGSLQDMAAGIDGMGGTASALDSFTKLGPNIAKIAGPFHTRQPYFAEYATTFQLTIVHTVLFGSWPVPTPIPLPKPNMLIPIFRATTLLYTGAMNASLGENTYLHSDWWGYGEGVVPAMLKVDPTGPLAAIKNLNLSNLKPNFNFETQFADLGQKIFEELVTFAFKEVGGKVISEVMKALVGPGSWIGALEGLMPEVGNKQSFLETMSKTVIDGTVGQIISELKNTRDKIEDEIDNAMASAYLREVSGPLIHAQSISVGGGGEVPKMMAGMLVAENDIRVDAETFVGSLTSFNGNIEAKKVYFTPLFTRASIYQPKATSTTSIGRVGQVGYGSDFDSQQAVDVGTGVTLVTTEGWNR